MATIAFAAIAASATTGASVATAAAITTAAVAAGSYIDAQYTYPMLFGGAGNRHLAGTKLDDVGAQTASEGSPTMYCLGAQNRVSGTVIWKSDITTTEIQDRGGGGKGGGGGGGGTTTSTRFVYSTSLAVAVCEGTVNSVRKIWADSHLIYDGEATDIGVGYKRPTQTLSAYRLVPRWRYHRGTWTLAQSSNIYAGEDMLVIAPLVGETFGVGDDPAPDLSNFVAGQVVDISGFEETTNNEPATVKSYSSNTGGYQELVLHRANGETAWVYDPQPPVNPNDNAGVVPDGTTITGFPLTVKQTVPMGDDPTVSFNQLNVHLGNNTSPDSIISSFAKAGELVPNYQDTVYVAFEELQLRAYGNRVPNFTFLVEERETLTLSEAVAALMFRAGYQSGDFDVTSLTGSVHGLTSSGIITPANMLAPLLEAYGVSTQTINGVITFSPKGLSTPITVQSGDLASRMSGDTAPHTLEIQEITDRDLYSEVNIGFINPANKWERGTQSAIKLDVVRKIPKNTEYAITMTDAYAKALAYRVLRTGWRESRLANATLPPSYLSVLENDVLQIAHNGQTHELRVFEVLRGDNFLVEVKGVLQRSATLAADLADQEDNYDNDPSTTDETLYFPPTPKIAVLDLPAMTESQISTFGHTLGICALGSADQWRGGEVHFSRSTTSSTYYLGASFTSEATIGFAASVLPVGATGYPDNVSTVKVSLYHGALTNATLLEVLDGANRAVLGDEIFGFTTATYDATKNEYTLSGLVRGLRGTELDIATHGFGEIFVLLDPYYVRYLEMSASEWKATKIWRGVTTGGDILNDDNPEEIVLEGVTKRPFAPYNTQFEYVSSDLVITWMPRSRSLLPIYSVSATPTYGDTKYVIALVNVSDIEYITFETSNLTYTVPEATLTAEGQPIKIRVYQKNDEYGIGRYEELTV